MAAAVLAVLDALCKMPLDELKLHEDEVLEAIQRLQRCIGRTSDNARPQSPSLDPQGPSLDPQSLPLEGQDPSPNIAPSEALRQGSQDLCPSGQKSLSSPKPRYPEPVRTFLRKFKDNLEATNEFVSKTPASTTILDRQLEGVDVRVADEVYVGGIGKGVKIAQLRRGLSQRSLAFDFESWEKKEIRTSTINKRAENLRSPGRSGNLSKFLSAKASRFGGIYMRSVRRAIDHGIRLVVCERLSKQMGYLAILMSRPRDFVKVRSEDLGELMCALRNDGMTKTFAEATNISSWMEDWVTRYNGKMPEPACYIPDFVAGWCKEQNSKLDFNAKNQVPADAGATAGSSRKRRQRSNASSQRKRHRYSSISCPSNTGQPSTLVDDNIRESARSTENRSEYSNGDYSNAPQRCK